MSFKLKHTVTSCEKALTCRYLCSSGAEKVTQTEIKPSSKEGRSHKSKLAWFFRTNPNLKPLKDHIPKKYYSLKHNTPENLYLIDPDIAKNIVTHIIPDLESNKNQLVCETNAGLGLISAELLNSGVNLVRLYESCSDFRNGLKEFDNIYPGRVELFTKDIFQLSRYDYMDKVDRGNRVEQLLKGLPQKSWIDDPAMTIIGTLPKTNFIKHLIIALILQKNLVTYGRIQLFAIMKPRDFVVIKTNRQFDCLNTVCSNFKKNKRGCASLIIFTLYSCNMSTLETSKFKVLSAGPMHNLHTYQSWSVLFHLFCDFKLLEKYPRAVFLPWESSVKITPKTRYPCRQDPDCMYLVQINLKKDLPVETEQLVAFFYFVKQFFGRRRAAIIPTIEKWVPGCGQKILIPKLDHKEDYFSDMDIFTEFGELTPKQFLYVFKEMVNYRAYQGSPFMAMVESQLLKLETIETSLVEASSNLEKNIIDDIEYKLGRT